MKAIAAYVRGSTEDQYEKFGPKVQEERILAYVKAHDTALREAKLDPDCVMVFRDACSGTLANRPELQTMKGLIAAGRIGHVIALDVSRLSRDLGNLVEMSKELEKHGCTIACVDQGFDTSTHTGKMVFQILGALAEYQRHELVERMRRGKHCSVRDTKAAWGGPAPYGFAYAKDGKGTLVPIPSELLTVGKILEMDMQDIGSHRIAAALVDDGITARRDKPFYRSLVDAIVKRRDFYLSDDTLTHGPEAR